ncbi:MAG TPA: hypothetical protein VFZ34_27580 [Blastocatellia bacterium]|nr:hypothetical protein [Blastocatellia bacterium]
MKLTSNELKILYRSQPARTELNRADCLSDTMLTRLGLKDVSEAERIAMADHLTTCPDCVQEYQLVHATHLWASETLNGSAKSSVSFATTETNPQQVEQVAAATDEAERTPKWWQSLLPRFFSLTGFNPFTAAVAGFFLITSLSLATWLVALQLKHKTELARLADQAKDTRPAMVATDEPVDAETLQARIDEAQKQLTDVQTQLVEQNADRVLSNQELLGIQNETLQKEIEELARPQLDTPIIELDSTKLPPPADPTKEPVTTIEVPPTSAVFTLILRKPAEKVFPSYQVELLDAKKQKPLWTGTKKQATEPMSFTLSLLRRNYPSGKYRVRLTGVDGKKKEPIVTYNLDVKYATPPKTTKKKR